VSRICPLFSSSEGNCTYIGTKDGAILIDAGASFKGIKQAVEEAGGSMDEIAAVLITHEHNDHIKGLKTLLNKTGARVLASEKTLVALEGLGAIPENIKSEAIEAEKREILGMEITRFATSHDCDGSSGYSILLPDGKRFSLCTDLGIVTETVRESILKSDCVLIESNHDIEMLKRGPYPPLLKMRILSDRGHISNNACSAELAALLKSGTTRFILGHLSQNNNTPLLAQSAAEAALMSVNAVNGKDYLLSVAKPKGNGVTVI
jgi:phosphoribosyl 1,2-cyclic phosphodiesterase